MALKRDTRYPGRFTAGDSAHPQGAFKNRSAPGAKDGSYLEKDWANDWDGFFAAVLTAAGVTANGNVDTALASQYYDALMSLLLRKANNLSEIATAGSIAQATARANIGITSGSLIPVGVPIPYPLAAAPSGFLLCAGQSFSTTSYPLLLAVYPSGILPDLRGEFIRGWDNGRGVDPSRSLLTYQSDAMRNFTGTLTIRPAVSSGGSSTTMTPESSGALSAASLSSTTTYIPAGTSGSVGHRGDVVTINPSNVVPTAAENRPRNVSFNYIVRAL